MPYIKEEARNRLEDNNIENEPLCQDSGELNYMITRFCDDYITRKGKTYQNLNEVIGVLECAKQEFYRRIVGPYEDRKIISNGEVYYNIYEFK